MFLMICLILLSKPAVSQASGAPDFSLSTTQTSSTVQSQFDVTVNATNLSDMVGYEINLTYDSTKLEFINYTAGNGGFTISPILITNGVQLAHTEIGEKPGSNGSAMLAKVTFKALQKGNAEIAITSIKLVDSQVSSVVYTSNASKSVTINDSTGGGGQPGGGQPGTGQPGAGQTGTSQAGNGEKGILIPDVQLDKDTHSVISTVDSDSLKRAQKEAVANEKGIKKISIAIPKNLDAKAYVQVVPTTLVSTRTKSEEIEIISDFATIVLPSNMLQKQAASSTDVRIRIAHAQLENLSSEVRNQVGTHPVIELSLESGNQVIPWNNSQAPVSVSIPYAPTPEELQNPEHIVVWYIDSSGNVTSVPSAKYNASTGSVTFKTTHFSTYAVAYLVKSFDDLQSVQWAQKQIEVLASKGIVNGMSETHFDPSQAITRADFLVLLARTLELHGDLGAAFSDVPQDAYYSESLRIARGLGITDGVGDNQFNPRDPITREDMMVLTARALTQTGSLANSTALGALDQFEDAGLVSSYAATSIATLVKNGLVQGYNQAIHPKETTTRAETVVLMYNIYNH
ncbi:S-layer homology domain-containing protein [Paenibacillus allorhizoplanae]|nr:S-layer homology domain-containing protein [Paenibacillus allorhizoplanae]